MANILKERFYAELSGIVNQLKIRYETNATWFDDFFDSCISDDEEEALERASTVALSDEAVGRLIEDRNLFLPVEEVDPMEHAIYCLGIDAVIKRVNDHLDKSCSSEKVADIFRRLK